MKPFLVLWLLIAAVQAVYISTLDDESILIVEQAKETGQDLEISSNLCWRTLSCTLFEIETMEMRNRLAYIKYIGSRKLESLKSTEEFHAVEGVLSFFVRRHLATPGTWLSVVNAAVLEAIQRGTAVALNQTEETGGNPAVLKWANFFNQRAGGALNNRAVSITLFPHRTPPLLTYQEHDVAWAVAEQTAVDYGIHMANSMPKIERPSTRISRWNQFTRVYRTIMQYRRTILWILRR